MKSLTKSTALLPLISKLKVCPAQDTSFSKETLVETWNCFKQLSLEQGDEVTPAVMAGLVLYDVEKFALLLNEVERAQMIALADLALERFNQKAHPPNKLGKTMAAFLKELT
jgi:hypothetical protein